MVVAKNWSRSMAQHGSEGPKGEAFFRLARTLIPGTKRKLRENYRCSTNCVLNWQRIYSWYPGCLQHISTLCPYHGRWKVSYSLGPSRFSQNLLQPCEDTSCDQLTLHFYAWVTSLCKETSSSTDPFRLSVYIYWLYKVGPPSYKLVYKPHENYSYRYHKP